MSIFAFAPETFKKTSIFALVTEMLLFHFFGQKKLLLTFLARTASVHLGVFLVSEYTTNLLQPYYKYDRLRHEKTQKI